MVAILLAPIPVRLRIHSSLVSTIFARSSLVTICSGTYEPVPMILVVILLTRPESISNQRTHAFLLLLAQRKYFEHQSNTTGYACICQEKFPGFGLGFPYFHRQNSPLCKKVCCKRFQMLIFFELFINFTFYYHILPFWGGRDIDFFWRIC